MHPYGYNDDYLMRLDDVLKFLPHVKPLKARATLKSWENEVFNKTIEAVCSGKERDVYQINIRKDFSLTSKDLVHILYDNGYSAVKVTPEGAGIIINAYQKGLFELKLHKYIEPVSCEIIEYSKSRESIFKRQKVDEAKRTEEKKQYKGLLINPQSIDPDKFTYSLLNDVFIEHFGLRCGSNSIKIGGIFVTKSVYMYTSNSGKTKDSNVIFSWKNENGEDKKLEKYSDFSQNRRNDPERNWGLHE